MDPLQHSWWGLELRTRLLSLTDVSFQTFFWDLMTLRHAGSFARVKPWGNIGDQKCDGYLIPEKRLFAVYAPQTFTLSAAKKKVAEDVRGALSAWDGSAAFAFWTLVYNCPGQDGVPSPLLQHALELFGSVTVQPEFWGQTHLQQIFWQLSDLGKESLLGHAPSVADVLAAGVPEVAEILQHVASQASTPPEAPTEISPKKLEYSGLSVYAQGLLKHGMICQSDVKLYVENSAAGFGERVCGAFRHEYERLETEGLSPDNIFNDLLAFTGVGPVTDLKMQAASLGVLAYLFERCDIYRDVPEQ